MDVVRQGLRWSLPGAITIAWIMFMSSVPQLVVHVGKGVPLPNLVSITTAEVAFSVFLSLPIGWIVYQISHFLSAQIFPTGIVRLDLAGSVLRPGQELRKKVQLLGINLPAKSVLPIEFSPIWHRYRRIRVWRLKCVMNGMKVNHELRHQWREQYTCYQAILHQILVISAAASTIGSKAKEEYDGFSDIYKGMAAARVGVLLGMFVGVLRILLYEGGTSYLTRGICVLIAVTLSMLLAGIVTYQRAMLLGRMKQVLLRILPRGLDAMLKDESTDVRSGVSSRSAGRQTHNGRKRDGSKMDRVKVKDSMRSWARWHTGGESPGILAADGTLRPALTNDRHEVKEDGPSTYEQ